MQSVLTLVGATLLTFVGAIELRWSVQPCCWRRLLVLKTAPGRRPWRRTAHYFVVPLRGELLENVRRHVERRVGPRNQTCVLAEHQQQRLVFRDSIERRPDLREERTFKVSLDAGKLGMGVLNVSIEIELEALDFLLGAVKRRRERYGRGLKGMGRPPSVCGRLTSGTVFVAEVTR